MKATYKPRSKDSGSFSIWLCLPSGPLAIAHRWRGSYEPATDPRDIMVRARRRAYLDRLREQFLPELGPDEGRAGRGTDYGHRAFCRSEELARAMARMALGIDSPGFKDHAEGHELHTAYMSMWSAMVKLDDNSPYNRQPASAKSLGQGKALGGTRGARHMDTDCRLAPSPLDSYTHTPRPQDCAEFGQHLWSGGDRCEDCGCVRTKLKNGGYRYAHPKGAVRLTDTWGKPLPRAA